jgi:hypothetical protein
LGIIGIPFVVDDEDKLRFIFMILFVLPVLLPVLLLVPLPIPPPPPLRRCCGGCDVLVVTLVPAAVLDIDVDRRGTWGGVNDTGVDMMMMMMIM